MPYSALGPSRQVGRHFGAHSTWRRWRFVATLWCVTKRLVWVAIPLCPRRKQDARRKGGLATRATTCRPCVLRFGDGMLLVWRISAHLLGRTTRLKRCRQPRSAGAHRRRRRVARSRGVYTKLARNGTQARASVHVVCLLLRLS